MGSDRLPIGFYWKSARAKEHLQALQVEILPFVGKGEAYTVVTERDPEGREFAFRLKVNRKPDTERWSLILGDCIHNARSALDHLFWGLVERNHVARPAPRSSATNFPILKDAGTFKGRKGKIEDLVGSAAFAKMERLQPFNNQAVYGDDSPLMLLHDLDIFDKHMLLVPAVTFTDKINLRPTTVENRNAVIDGAITISFVGIEDGAEVARIKVRNPQDVVNMHLEVSCDVVLKWPTGNKFIMPMATELLQLVDQIGADFVELF